MERLLAHLRSRFFLVNFLILFVLSILAGHWVVTHNHEGWFLDFIKRPGYFPSVGYSSLIALILLLTIYGVSYRMFECYGGAGLSRAWIAGQLKYGIGVVILVELVLAALLFHIMGYQILETSYFRKLFRPIVLFIFAVNLAYILYFRNRETTKVRYKFLDGHQHAAMEEGDVDREVTVALWYMEDGEVLCVSFDGRPDGRKCSLSTVMEELDPKIYFRGARDWIVHRDMISGVKSLSGYRLQIFCKFGDHRVIVSRRNVARFKLWFDME